MFPIPPAPILSSLVLPIFFPNPYLNPEASSDPLMTSIFENPNSL